MTPSRSNLCGFVARLPALLATAVLAGACSTGPEEGSYFIRCPEAMRVHIAPSAVQLAVGDSLVARAHFGVQADCAPPAPDRPDQWRWSSRDTLVAVVDSARGLVRARRAGATVLAARHVLGPFFADSVVLRVTGP